MNLKILTVAFLLATSPLIQAGPLDWTWTRKKISDHPIIATVTASIIGMGTVCAYLLVSGDEPVNGYRTHQAQLELDNNSPISHPTVEQEKTFFSIAHEAPPVNVHTAQMQQNDKPAKQQSPRGRPVKVEYKSNGDTLFTFYEDTPLTKEINLGAQPKKSCLKKATRN